MSVESLFNIESISLTTIRELDKDRFNSNNHWIDNKRPTDYQNILEKGRLEYWIDKFRTYYTIFNIPAKELKWIKKAYNIGNVTFQFPKAFEDELEAFLIKFKGQEHEIFDNGTKDYFV